jgi:hypothetical protein
VLKGCIFSVKELKSLDIRPLGNFGLRESKLRKSELREPSVRKLKDTSIRHLRGFGIALLRNFSIRLAKDFSIRPLGR